VAFLLLCCELYLLWENGLIAQAYAHSHSGGAIYVSVVNEMAQRALNLVTDWCSDNVSMPKELNRPFSLKLKINNQEVPTSKTMKYLGVIFDRNQTWKIHLEMVIKKPRLYFTLFGDLSTTSKNG